MNALTKADDVTFLRGKAIREAHAGNDIEADRLFEIANRIEFGEHVYGVANSATLSKFNELLRAQDANGRKLLKETLTTAFDEFVIELPGPNAWTKSKAMPYVEDAAENIVTKICE